MYEEPNEAKLAPFVSRGGEPGRASDDGGDQRREFDDPPGQGPTRARRGLHQELAGHASRVGGLPLVPCQTTAAAADLSR